MHLKESERNCKNLKEFERIRKKEFDRMYTKKGGFEKKQKKHKIRKNCKQIEGFDGNSEKMKKKRMHVNEFGGF